MYTFKQLMSPIWTSNIIYDESCTMIKCNGIAEAPLLFPVKKIISVTSADKTMEYKEELDWELRENKLYLTPTSRIFAFEEQELIFSEEKAGECFPTKDGRYSLFHEGHFFHDRQISVTYQKQGNDFDYTPAYCEELLPKTLEKLRNKDSVKIVLYGDSISAGSNCSGMTLTTPFLPRWGDLLAENLRRNYHADIEFINTAVGGKDSHWGMENATALVGDYVPDLAIIAFGMNDSDMPEKFASSIQIIMRKVLEVSPETEFILCATTVPNIILKDFYKCQNEYGDEIRKLQKQGIAIADFYDMQKWLMKKKRFIDMTGNNVNHPNDFLIRCHAQLISAMLIEQPE